MRFGPRLQSDLSQRRVLEYCQECSRICTHARRRGEHEHEHEHGVQGVVLAEMDSAFMPDYGVTAKDLIV